MNSVHHLTFQYENRIVNWTNHFPNVTQFTFDCRSREGNEYVLPMILNRIVPLKQITKLDIASFGCDFKDLVQLLTLTPNIDILGFGRSTLEKTDLHLIQQDETFQIVSTTNKIKRVNFRSECTFAHIKLFMNLFPQLECLLTSIAIYSLEPSIRFLLSKTNDKTYHLHSLSMPFSSKFRFEKIMNLLQSENLPVDCVIDDIGCIRLWW